jgi:hypothetical protein
MENSGNKFHGQFSKLTQNCKHNFIREHIHINKHLSYFNFIAKKNNRGCGKKR